jgi:hypothetical protein
MEKVCLLPALDLTEEATDENKDYLLLMHKIKTHSVHSRSNNSLHSLALHKQRLQNLV